MTRARRALLAVAVGIALAAGYSARVAADVPVIDTAAWLASWPTSWRMTSKHTAFSSVAHTPVCHQRMIPSGKPVATVEPAVQAA